MDKMIDRDAKWRVRRYTPADLELWEEAVANSRNATFLFSRRFMDYHADRFRDFSLIAEHPSRRPALLPANITADGVLHSHQGLSYGGWILPLAGFSSIDFTELWQAFILACKDFNISGIDYKPIPSIYHRIPAEDDLYEIFRNCGRLTERTLSSVIRLAENPGLSKTMRRQLRRASEDKAVRIGYLSEAAPFMEMLTECLRERHGASPVHTTEELQFLRDRFPENIKLAVVVDREGLQAGVCLFESAQVCHAQYIASSPRGREKHYLPFLFSHLIAEASGRFLYFDFGISTEDHGKLLNLGLTRQKCALGGSGAAFDRYFIPL